MVKKRMNEFENYWKGFLTLNSKGKEVYDGQKFEKLTKELLSILYGEYWEETGASHDGSKDFYLIRDQELLWAECKNYKDSIALNVLAPTLVMAQVCDANVILFFSRSAINKFAKEKISSFGFRTSKKVIFYDAEILESLILKYNNQLPHKYQISNSTKDIQKEKFEIRISEKFFPSTFSCMITEKENYRSYEEATVLHYNVPFSLLLICCNNTIQSGNLEVFFAEDNEDKKYYEFLNDNITLDTILIAAEPLQLGESKAFLINLRVAIFKPFISLPRFTVRFKTSEGKTFKWESNPKNVKCEWVGTTKLLGQHYNSIVTQMGDKLIGNNSFSVLLLSGSSGTGKSKVLCECKCPLLKYGYRILELNVTKGHEVSGLLKEIIYFLYEIPAEIIMEVIKARLDGTEYNINDINETIRISKMIDAIDTNNFYVFMKNYKELLFEKMAACKIAVIVDNLQFAVSEFHEFWNNYIRYSVNQCRENNSILIVSVNSDYMTEGTANTMYLLKHSNIRYFLDEVVDGFKEVNQGILFLRELIHTSESSYDPLFKNIINSLSLNPFHLYQMVKLMEEDEVVRLLPDGQGYIFSEEAIWKTTWKIPQNIDDILERRLEFIRKYLTSEKLYNILSVCYILEAIDQTKSNIFHITQQELNFLVERQILALSELGYVFAHDIIRSFFERKYSDKRLACLKNMRLYDSTVLQYSIIDKLNKICIKKESQYLITFCKKRKLNNIPIRVRSFFVENLFNSVITEKAAFRDYNEWIISLAWICSCTRTLMGSARALKFYDWTYNCIENEMEHFSIIYSTELRQFFHSHCDILIQMHRRNEAIDYAERVLELTADLPAHLQSHSDEEYGTILDEYYVLRAIMYNRIFCAYNNRYPDTYIIQKRNKAIAKSRNLISFIQNTFKRNLITYLNNSDEGYRYYGLFSDYNRLISIWKKCLIDVPKTAPEKTMNYYRKCVQYYLIAQDKESTQKYIKVGRDYLEDGKYSHEPLIFNTFFTMAEAMCYLQHDPIENYMYVESLLKELTKIQLVLKNNKIGDIFLLKAINAFYQGDEDTVYLALKKAYSFYYETETTNYWIKRILITENIVTAFSRLEIKQSAYDFSFLPREVRERLSHLQPNDINAQGIIRTKDLLFNLPLVV
jgi:hypothetical protein